MGPVVKRRYYTLLSSRILSRLNFFGIQLQVGADPMMVDMEWCAEILKRRRWKGLKNWGECTLWP